MHITLIIPTRGRPPLVARLLSHLERQTRRPDHVIVSASAPSDIEPYPTTDLKTSYTFGDPGSCAQRNRALALCESTTDIICFFDDDFVPCDRYLEDLEQAFVDHPDYAVIMGNLLADGARGAGYTFDEALDIIAAGCRTLDGPPRIAEHPGAYGNNMSIRAAVLGSRRFDERLPLYGWQEDIDLTSPLRAHGRIVSMEHLWGVHLGVKGGRVSGVRLGYSQVVNPVYLIGKGTMQMGFGLKLMVRNVAANVVKSFKPEPYVDRRGRLKGNIIGVLHVVSRRAHPEYILKL